MSTLEVLSREARIRRATDSRCLAHMLPWMRRSVALIGVDLLLAYLAANAGASWWAALWLAVRVAHRTHFVWLARGLGADTTCPVKKSLARATAAYWLGGFVNALILPAFFFGAADVVTMLLVTVLTIWLGGPMVVGSSGLVWAFAGGSIPAAVLTTGWVLEGGLRGFGLALLCALSLLTAFSAVKQQRRALEELVRLLDDNELLATSLASERDRAESASESKTRFFAAASHDLRQPMHALSVNATTLELVARRSEDPVLKDLSQGISSALRQSRSLLDGLLDISRLDAHAVRAHLVATHVGGVFEALRDEYDALAEKQGLTLLVEFDSGEDALWVLTDPDQLMRIMGNLLDNAIKFTRKGTIRLSARREATRVIVHLSDSGPGISESERERVFEEFYQVGNLARDRSHGLGLGLAIVKRTAALLDIGIRLTCPAEGGTAFELSLLGTAPGSAVAVAPTSEPFKGRRLYVLLVDDEIEVQKSLCIYLRQIGWTARAVDSGSEAEEALAAGFPADVLVIDFRLRDETAREVIARLRAQNIALPIVIVTGDTASERLRELSDLASSVLHKPLDGERLARALHEAVAR